MNEDETNNDTLSFKGQSLSGTKLVVVISAGMFLFLFGYVTGSLLNSDGDSSEELHQHVDDVATHSSHSHEHYDVVDGEVVPEITNLSIEKDAKSGWNVSFETANFKFTPENVNQAHVPGEGHAHIYVDGVKVNRLYSSDYYLAPLSEGEHRVRIVLNTNDHQEYTVNSESVDVSQVVSDQHHSNSSN